MQTQCSIPTFGDTRLPARFWAKVNPNGPIPAHRPELGPCWEWTGSHDTHGYGQLWWEGRHVPAHRLAYAQLIGCIPKGLECDHLCRNHSCVNPDHLFLATHQENMADMVRKGRGRGVNGLKTHCPQGHEYAGANLKVNRGHRYCRACHTASRKRRKAQLKEQPVRERC